MSDPAGTTPPTGADGGAPGSSLLRRVFAANAAVLVVAAVALVVGPVTISSTVVVREVLVVAASVAVLLLVNLLLLRRSFEPLSRLTATMSAIDPLEPGQRVGRVDGDADVVALTQAFNAMLARLEDERRESARRALAAQEEERLRLARELHDEIGQALTGAVLQVERAVREAPDAVRAPLADARETIRAALEDVRRVSSRLRPEALDDLGLASALDSLARGVQRRSGLRIERALAHDLTELPAETELVLYRVAQESLTNSVRHARASAVRLSLTHDADGVELRVADDGVGLASGVPGASNGIRGMRERALLVGGDLTLASSAAGTTVALRVPLP